MTPYNVYFALAFGNQLILRMIWENKHRSEEDFQNDIERLAHRLDATFIRKEKTI